MIEWEKGKRKIRKKKEKIKKKNTNYFKNKI